MGGYSASEDDDADDIVCSVSLPDLISRNQVALAAHIMTCGIRYLD